MLQVIRDRAQGFIAWFIVGAIVLSFALWGVNDYLTDDDAGFNAATVNGNEVSIYEYQVAYQNERARMQQMFGDRFDSDLFDDQIKKAALERVIDNALLTQLATDSGFTIGDAQLAARLHAIEAFQEEGEFSKVLYEQQIQTSGESTAGFEFRMRRALLADQLILGVASTDFATELEVDALGRLRGQEREASYLVIRKDQFSKDLALEQAEIQQYYQDSSEQFKTEEQISVDYLELSVDDLARDIDVAEDELQEAYEAQRERFVSPEERRASHILIQIDDKTDSDAAKTRIVEIQNRIQQGEAFADLAKALSEDPGSAGEGGDLGFFARGIMDPEFEDAAFSLSVGQISEPVRSQFGYHLIRLEESRGGEGKRFSEVRDELMTELKRKKAERLYFDQVEQLANLTYEMPDSLEPAMEELGLRLKTTPFFSRRGGSGIAANRKVIDAAFSDDVLVENINSEALEISKGRTVVLHKKAHQPAELPPLAEVRDRVESLLKNERVAEKAAQTGEKLADQIREGGDLQQLAKQNAFEWKPKRWFKRGDSEQNGELARTLFKMAKPRDNGTVVEGAALSNGDYVVLNFSAVRDGGVAEDEKQGMASSLASASGLDAFTSLLKTLKDQAEIVRHPGNL